VARYIFWRVHCAGGRLQPRTISAGAWFSIQKRITAIAVLTWLSLEHTQAALHVVWQRDFEFE